MANALLIIDLQQEFTRRIAAGIPASNPTALANVAALLAAHRAKSLPIIHIHHDDPRPSSGFRMDKPTGAPIPDTAPIAGEVVFVKHTSSAFADGQLATHLRAQGITHLTIAGAAINYCVASTVRSARDLGFASTLVQDAVFGFGTTAPDGRSYDPDTVLAVTLGTLCPDFARAMTADQAIAAL